MFLGYQGDFHSAPVSVPCLQAGKHSGMSRRSLTISRCPMVTHGHSACVNGLFTKHGPWQRMLGDAAMMLPLSDAAREEETLTMILTLRMRARGGLLVCVRVARPPGDSPIVCQCAGRCRDRWGKESESIVSGPAATGMEWAGGHFSKSSSF